MFKTAETTGEDYFFDFFGDALPDFWDHDGFGEGADEGWLIFELATRLHIGTGTPLIANSLIIVFHS